VRLYLHDLHFPAFAALKADGSITAWGDENNGGEGAPRGNGYVKIYSTYGAFAALKADGSIMAWGNSDSGGTNARTISFKGSKGVTI
jgi:hypothetical protein